MCSMEDLVETVNQLQDVFSTSGYSGIDLPQIVVVGTQSSGKSSVLEHIVGRSFLPRGTGVVTRCPLVLQLVRAPEGTSADKEYAIFQHDKTRVFTDYCLISKEIEEQTGRLAGQNKGICSTPIHLKLYSTSFLNLTMVDLPGLTKVPVGDQPTDIENQTRSLIQSYIGNPDSIIVAVTPANVDMATSESLKIAREVDPEGKRTLAVITKLDLMDDGTDGWDMLSGKIIPVKLGIIGVVNRSQKDIQEDKTIEESLEDEAKFFNRFYKNIASSNGSPYLTKRVQTILVNHIKSCMPELKEKIKQKLYIRNGELKLIKDCGLEKPALLLDLMAKFSMSYVSAIRGNLTNVQTKKLYGGARINYVFRESFSSALRSVDALSGLSRVDVITAMQNSTGVNTSIFVPEIAFELLVKKQIEKLRNPCLQCVDKVHKELNYIVQSCIEDVSLGLTRYPKMQRELETVVVELLQNRLPITNQMVDHLLDVQLAYINTSHPDFLPNSVKGLTTLNGGDSSNQSDGYKAPHQKNPFTTLGHQGDNAAVITQQPFNSLLVPDVAEDKGSRDYIWIQQLIKSYFSIVQKMIQDMVPKIIMHFLVNFVVDHLQLELVANLYKSDVDDLLQESKVIADKRKALTTEIVALEQANDIVNHFSPVKMSGKHKNAALK